MTETRRLLTDPTPTVELPMGRILYRTPDGTEVCEHLSFQGFPVDDPNHPLDAPDYFADEYNSSQRNHLYTVELDRLFADGCTILSADPQAN